ncbi:MAG: hypothetical protein MASP_01899 [Candidatus Methanolliviera sp. GoM_asphalt]|nr:MAG: hypothetical protein MASP_01899 [Candidatus Methanolliviera sp. GoM_asphalt]
MVFTSFSVLFADISSFFTFVTIAFWSFSSLTSNIFVAISGVIFESGASISFFKCSGAFFTTVTVLLNSSRLSVGAISIIRDLALSSSIAAIRSILLVSISSLSTRSCSSGFNSKCEISLLWCVYDKPTVSATSFIMAGIFFNPAILDARTLISPMINS